MTSAQERIVAEDLILAKRSLTGVTHGDNTLRGISIEQCPESMTWWSHETAMTTTNILGGAPYTSLP